jgi:phage shock protein A
MAETTDIEKKSLEAHVELCAQRYKFLEDKLASVEEKCDTLVSTIAGVKTVVDAMATKNNDRLIQWGVGIIGFLIATCGYLINHYVVK